MKEWLIYKVTSIQIRNFAMGLDGCMGGWKDGHMDGCIETDGWGNPIYRLGGWMDGWMDGYISVR